MPFLRRIAVTVNVLSLRIISIPFLYYYDSHSRRLHAPFGYDPSVLLYFSERLVSALYIYSARLSIPNALQLRDSNEASN